MARGYPDYFGTSIWPKYGTPIITEGDETVDGGDDRDVITVSCQGILMWFLAELYNPPNTFPGTGVALTIDGVEIVRLFTTAVYGEGYSFNGRLPMYIRYLNLAAQRAIYENGIEIPFHSGFKISLINSGNVDAERLLATSLHYVVT